jgi:hypothetical protein
LVVAPSTCSISGRLLPLQYYSKTPKHNQALRPGTIRNANILSPLDVKRKKDQPGCRWRRGLLVVGGRASVVVARTTCDPPVRRLVRFPPCGFVNGARVQGATGREDPGTRFQGPGNGNGGDGNGPGCYEFSGRATHHPSSQGGMHIGFSSVAILAEAITVIYRTLLSNHGLPRR